MMFSSIVLGRLFICLIIYLVGGCVCPSSYELSRYRLTPGTWEFDQNGNFPNDTFAVIGAIDPVDGEEQPICRARDEDAMIPGRLSPIDKKCYVSRSGREHKYTSYEVLVNREGYDLEWVASSDGNIVDGVVLGGFASGWPMFICRAWHKGRQEKWRYVSGKLDPEPGYECCYIPYGGYEHCYKGYQLLRNKPV